MVGRIHETDNQFGSGLLEFTRLLKIMNTYFQNILLLYAERCCQGVVQDFEVGGGIRWRAKRVAA